MTALRAETHGGFLDVNSSHSLKYSRLWGCCCVATVNISFCWMSAEKRRVLVQLPHLEWRCGEMLLRLRVRIDSEGWGGKKKIERSHPSHGCYVGNLCKHGFFQASQSLLTFVSEALMATCQKIFLGLFSLATYNLESLHDLVTTWQSGSEIFKASLTWAQVTDPAHSNGTCQKEKEKARSCIKCTIVPPRKKVIVEHHRSRWGGETWPSGEDQPPHSACSRPAV